MIEELDNLAHETRRSRSRFLEKLIAEARPVLEASAVIAKRRRPSWWRRLPRIGGGEGQDALAAWAVSRLKFLCLRAAVFRPGPPSTGPRHGPGLRGRRRRTWPTPDLCTKVDGHQEMYTVRGVVCMARSCAVSRLGVFIMAIWRTTATPGASGRWPK